MTRVDLNNHSLGYEFENYRIFEFVHFILMRYVTVLKNMIISIFKIKIEGIKSSASGHFNKDTILLHLGLLDFCHVSNACR